MYQLLVAFSDKKTDVVGVSGFIGSESSRKSLTRKAISSLLLLALTSVPEWRYFLGPSEFVNELNVSCWKIETNDADD